MKSLFLKIFFCFCSVYAFAQENQSEEPQSEEPAFTLPFQLDSLQKWDAKKVTKYIDLYQKEYKDISNKRQKLEISLMSNKLRTNLRGNTKNRKSAEITETKAETETKNSDFVAKDNSSAPENDINNTLATDNNENTWTAEKELQLLVEAEDKKKAEIATLSKALELQTKALELSDLKQRNMFFGSGILFIFLSFIVVNLYRGNSQKKKMNVLLFEEKKKTESERDKSDELLLNILPLPIAEELKTNGKAKVRHYDLATVLFTDFKGFTSVAEKMSPAELVEELDTCFAKFDEIITQCGMEKIKTIGDAYMCVGGIPEPNNTNPIDAVIAGLKIQQFMAEKRQEKLSQGNEYWQCRLGINSGDLIAGVIGKKKFAYDVWGDTVNTGSRMESSGEVGRVNISGQTYAMVKDYFVCEYRGKVDAKGKGEVDMYFVSRIKPEFSADEMGLEPNERLLQMML